MNQNNARPGIRLGRIWLGAAVVLVAAGAASAAAEQQVKSFVYKTIGQRKLEIHVHYPPDWKPSDKRPAIIFFFGGGWTGGTPEQFTDQAAYLAGRGLVAARADYRVKSRDGVTPDKCVEDARSAVRWMRKNSRMLGIDPGKLIASGGSAGGHLAACTMIPESVEAEGDDLSISTVPQAMVLFNPVLSFMHERIIGRINGDKALARKISPTLHLKKDSPPALILFGSNDALKAFGDEYWAKAEKLGVRAEKFIAEGQGHGFFNRPPWKQRTLIATDKFLASLGYLKGEPTVKVPPEGERPQARPRGQALRDIAARLRTLDKNGDGKISKDEAPAPIKNNFQTADTDGDGFIEPAELRQVLRRLGGRRRPRAPLRHPDTTGWRDLFAPDLADAVKPEGVWTVEDGVLTASADQAIWTDRDYENFILDLEFKNAEGTNSGVVLCCSDIENWIPNSVEVQIADDFAEQWAKQPATWHCGAIFGHLAPRKSAVKRPGQWNRMTIRCIDGKIDVLLNGQHVSSMDMRLWTSAEKNPDGSDIPPWLSKPVATLGRKGRIGLQGKHAGAPIWFRNIKIKQLK